MNIKLSSEIPSLVVVKKDGMQVVKQLDFTTTEEAEKKAEKIISSLASRRDEYFRYIEGDVDTFISENLILYLTK